MDINPQACYNESRKIPYEKLTLANDFIFCKVMQNEKLCKELLERILNVQIERIVYTESQKVLDDSFDGKSIRLDVYVKDENHTVYDIEMQTSNTGELPKRSRFYHSCIDKSQLQKGKLYKELKESYVIFICTFDLFKKGFAKYTFDSICNEDKMLYLSDLRHTIFVNTEGVTDNTQLQEFLEYLRDGSMNDSEFIHALDREVKYASRNAEWKEEYEMLVAREQVIWDDGHEKGHAQGRQEEKIKLIKNALTQATPDIVSKLLNIPLEEILRIQKSNIQ